MSSPRISIIPDMPRDSQVVDSEGRLTSHWRLYFDQMTEALQRVISNEGTIMPQQTTAGIAQLSGAQSLGAVIFNTDTSTYQVNVAANTWKTITVT